MARWRSAGLLSRQLVSRPSDLSGFCPAWRVLLELGVAAVRCKDAVEAWEVDSRLRYQRSEFGDEVQRLEDHMGGAIAVRSFELVTHLPIGG